MATIENPTEAPKTDDRAHSGDNRRLKVLLIAPFYDKNRPGESWSTYKWVEGISRIHDVTVLTTHRKSWSASGSPTKATQIVNWNELQLPAMFARLSRELKPTYPIFYLRARKWIKDALSRGEQFDLAHQINPLALRYPSPVHGLGIEYLIGPLAGSLLTPPGFRDGTSDKQWYRKLRNIDRFRIKNDPLLRSTYAGAKAILGVAPYVEEILRPAGISRFETVGETGVEEISFPNPKQRAENEPLRLLFVGRIIRTKGVIDAIRAVKIASQSCRLHFDIVGEGDMGAACKEEAKRLDLESVVHFHGRIPRSEVDHWYQQAHVFLFPSFREPSGNVVFEAMGHGLPVISSTVGGPSHVVTHQCGLQAEPTNPEDYAQQLATHIEAFYQNEKLLPSTSKGAIERMRSIAYWPNKIESLSELYQNLVPPPLSKTPTLV